MLRRESLLSGEERVNLFHRQLRAYHQSREWA